MTESFDPRALATKLRGLRQAAKQEPTSAFQLPAGLHQAMEAQDIVKADDGCTSNAWKVSVFPDGQPVTAPIYPFAEAVSGATIPWYPGLKFEAEIAVRFGKDLPYRKDAPYSRAEVIDAISTAYLGAELLVNAVKEANAISVYLYLVDRLANSGYVLGPSIPKSFIDTAAETPLKVTHGGKTIYDDLAKHPKGDVVSWLLAYANDPLRPADSLKAGAVITTGTLSGAVELTEPGEIDIRFGDDARLTFSVV